MIGTRRPREKSDGRDRIARVGCWLVALTLVGTLTAQAPGEGHSTATLIEQLASENFLEREAAQAALLLRGPEVQRELERVVAQTRDEEQRLRGSWILREIRKRTLWEPSRVTLPSRELTVIEAAELIAEQAGNPLNTERLPKTLAGTVTGTGQPMDYWQAIDLLAREGSVRTRFFDDPQTRGAVLEQGAAAQYPTSVAGPVRLLITNARRTRNESIDFQDTNIVREDEIDFSYALEWEQRLALCRYGSYLRVTEAITDTGESCVPRPRSMPGIGMHLTRRQRLITLTGRLLPPKKSATRISKLAIDLDLDVAGDFETLTLPGTEVPSTVRSAGYEMTLVALSQLPNRSWEAKIQLERPAPYDRLNATDMVDEYLEVLDAQGKSIPYHQQQVIGDRLKVVYTLLLRVGQPRELSYRYSIALVRARRTVTFRFTEVPLPVSNP